MSQFGDLAHDKNILHFPPASNWDETREEHSQLDALHDSGMIQFYDEEDMQSESPPSTVIKPVVHGIFVSSLFSAIFGTLSPGCVYMNQTLQFSNPVFVDDRVIGRVDIEKIRKWRKGGVVVQCRTIATVAFHDDYDGRTAVTGTANVWLPTGYAASKEDEEKTHSRDNFFRV